MDGDFQERNRALAEFLADVALRRSADDTISHITENGARLLGRQAEQIVDSNFEDLVHPDDRALLPELWNRVGREGNVPVELRMLRGDARTVFIQGTAMRYVDDTFIFFGRDATAQHLEAEELRSRAERFTTVADSVPAMLWMTAADGNTEFVNRAVVEFLEGDVEHDRETWAEKAVHPDDRERLNRVIADAVEKVEPFSVEARVLNGRGEYRWLLMQAQPRFGSDEQFAGHVGVSIDVTSSKLAEESMRRAEGLTSMANLATGIAHEINDPLTAIRAAAEVALQAGERCNLGHAVEQSLRRVLTQAERATRITRDVLRFARSDDVSAELTDLNELVHGVVEQVSENVRVTQASLGCELDPKLPLLRLRRSELILAISNLIQNAVESSERPVFVQVRTELREDRAMVWVLDDGDGISEEALAQIFDPFFTTRRRRGSVGLGLSLVQRIVLDHRGAIEVQSTLDGGTAFGIALPLEDPTRS